jgi:hypothetical protein
VKHFRPLMQGLLTISLMGAALYVMMDRSSPPEAQKWAPGIIGTLIGYWLRGRQSVGPRPTGSGLPSKASQHASEADLWATARREPQLQ